MESSTALSSTLIETLSRNGLKPTVGRLQVLALFQDQMARSSERAYKELLRKNATISLTTTYRVIGQFAKAGILDRRQFELGPCLYRLKDTELRP